MTEGSKTHDVSYKVILLGETAVGKSSLMRCLQGEEFHKSMSSTIGFDVAWKVLQLENGVQVQLQVWDTAGQEQFHAITRSHFHGAKGVVLVYDVTSRQSFQLLTYWLKSLELKFTDSAEGIPVFVVANKSDLEEKREISTEEGKGKADASGTSGFRETSVKTDPQGVYHLFEEMAYTLTERYDPDLIAPNLSEGQRNEGGRSIKNRDGDKRITFHKDSTTSGSLTSNIKLGQSMDNGEKKIKCCLSG